MPNKHRVAILSVLALSLLAAGCTNEKLADAVCPTAGTLIEASTLTRFMPGAVEDPAHRLFRVDLTGVHRACSVEAKTRTVDASLSVDFRAIRNPSREPADFTAPYFVAVQSGGEITVKQVFNVHFHFDPGQATADATEEIESVVIHPAPDKQSFDYQLLAGLQLTQAELDYNRRQGLYGP